MSDAAFERLLKKRAFQLYKKHITGRGYAWSIGCSMPDDVQRAVIEGMREMYELGRQSGISSPSHRPNEQNAVVQTEQPSLSDARPKWRSDLLDGVDLEELEAAAMKATHVLYTHPRDDNGWRENTDLAKHLSAGVVIGLVQAARTLLAQRQDSDKDAAPVNRYKVTKKSGIWYAHVIDTETDETIHRFDIRKNGWSEAEKCCERLNGSATRSVMAKDR